MDSKAKQGALLYVSETPKNRVLVYSYPDLQLKGTLAKIYRPQGLCVNQRTQNVWVVEGAFANKVVEFTHGGTTPIRRLKIDSALFPQACAVDSKTGDIAVASQLAGDDPGGLTVFKSGRGQPAFYQKRKIFYYGFVGYDNDSNAFVDGTGFGPFRLAELPAGGQKLKIVPLSIPKYQFPSGGVQYDGTNLAVGDEKRGVIYQTSGGTVVGTTTLKGTCLVQQFFIDAGQVIAPNVCNGRGNVLIYNYPAGGTPIAKISGLTYPFGTAISH